MPVQLPSEAAIVAWARLVRTHGKIFGAIEADLKAAGFPPLSWYDVLLELRRAGALGLRPKDLEKHLLIAQHNVSRLIDRIEAEGYLRRQASPLDRRSQIVTLTRAGQELLRRMWPVYGAAIQRHFAKPLGDDAAATKLADLLGRILGQTEKQNNAE